MQVRIESLNNRAYLKCPSMKRMSMAVYLIGKPCQLILERSICIWISFIMFVWNVLNKFLLIHFSSVVVSKIFMPHFVSSMHSGSFYVVHFNMGSICWIVICKHDCLYIHITYEYMCYTYTNILTSRHRKRVNPLVTRDSAHKGPSMWTFDVSLL